MVLLSIGIAAFKIAAPVVVAAVYAYVIVRTFWNSIAPSKEAHAFLMWVCGVPRDDGDEDED